MFIYSFSVYWSSPIITQQFDELLVKLNLVWNKGAKVEVLAGEKRKVLLGKASAKILTRKDQIMRDSWVDTVILTEFWAETI